MPKSREDNTVDPRSVTDKRILEEYSREEVEAWRREAVERHQRWMEVMHNQYGKD